MYFLVVLSTLVGAGLAWTNPKMHCPRDWEKTGNPAFPIPGQPTKYVVCGHGTSSRIYECAPNQHFDPKARQCAWDRVQHGHMHPCPKDWAKRSYNAYPDPSNSHKYYVCGNQGARKLSCPHGLKFDEELHYCA